MGLRIVFKGVDHFVNAQPRYVPMIPDLLEAQARFWVCLTGVAELAGGLVLLVPQRLLDRLGLPRLHQLAGLGLAALLVCVVANVHVVQQGQQVHGLPVGAWYYWLRPLMQPVFILWALYCSGVWVVVCARCGGSRRSRGTLGAFRHIWRGVTQRKKLNAFRFKCYKNSS